MMTMISHLQRLLAYDCWANKEVLASLRKIEKPPVQSIGLIAHILSAERLWLERIEAHAQTLPVWPDFTFQQCENETADIFWQYERLLSGKDDDALAEEVTYTNSKGESFTSEVRDILMHVITHSMYHRGQIALAMRAAGFEPAYTDFIHSVRQGLIE
jgi:uncharacterized damage-inducible protein DinB